MKQLTKAVSASCILFLTYAAALAQTPTVAYTEHTFSYDANGNRVKREQIFITVFLRNANPDSTLTAEQPENEDQTAFNDEHFVDKPSKIQKHELSLAGHRIIAYPNPVTEVLNLEIEAFKSNPNNTVRLYEMTGKLLTEKKLQNSMYLSFSDYPAGAYLLVIYIEGKRKEVEIIKN